MGDKSEIQWTDATWNPVTGCSKVSPGCAHCYAEALSMRYARGWRVPGLPWTPENAEANVILRPERLDQPLRWKKPRMIFVNSMSDLFHELVPDDYIGEVFDVMARCPQHIFQVLTKRPERMRDLLSSELFRHPLDLEGGTLVPKTIEPWPLPNVWLGTSIENRQFVGRADAVRETPAAIRFVSAEPLLGPLVYDAVSMGTPSIPFGDRCWSDGIAIPQLDFTGLDWLIVGGESGPKHRRMDLDWVRDLRNACTAPRELGERGTAFFFKQYGGKTPKSGGRLLDGREWNEMPETRSAIPAGGGT